MKYFNHAMFKICAGLKIKKSQDSAWNNSETLMHLHIYSFSAFYEICVIFVF